jgi:hypothetical protein
MVCAAAFSGGVRTSWLIPKEVFVTVSTTSLACGIFRLTRWELRLKVTVI